MLSQLESVLASPITDEQKHVEMDKILTGVRLPLDSSSLHQAFFTMLITLTVRHSARMAQRELLILLRWCLMHTQSSDLDLNGSRTRLHNLYWAPSPGLSADSFRLFLRLL